MAPLVIGHVLGLGPGTGWAASTTMRVGFAASMTSAIFVPSSPVEQRPWADERLIVGRVRRGVTLWGTGADAGHLLQQRLRCEGCPRLRRDGTSRRARTFEVRQDRDPPAQERRSPLRIAAAGSRPPFIAVNLCMAKPMNLRLLTVLARGSGWLG